MRNEIIARKTVDIRSDEHRKVFPAVAHTFTVDVFESGSAIITSGNAHLTAMVHTDEERLLAIAETLQSTVADARAKRAADAVPACCVGGLCPEHQPVPAMPMCPAIVPATGEPCKNHGQEAFGGRCYFHREQDAVIAEYDAEERLEGSTP